MPVTGDNGWVPVEHPPRHDVSIPKHDRQPGANRVAGAHDGPGEIVALGQQFLAGDLVLAIRPIGIDGRCFLGDHIMTRRLFVDRRRGDEDVLPAMAGKHIYVPRHLIGRERDELADDVVIGLIQPGAANILELPHNRSDAGGKLALT